MVSGLHKNVTRGYLVNEDSKDVLRFQFNPETFTDEYKASYKEVESPGSEYRKIYYAGHEAEKFSLTLWFYGVTNIIDGKSSSDIIEYLKALTRPCKYSRRVIQSSDKFVPPPLCTLCIGEDIQQVVVESCSVTRSMFNNELKVMTFGSDIKFMRVERDNNMARRIRVELPAKYNAKKQPKKYLKYYDEVRAY